MTTDLAEAFYAKNQPRDKDGKWSRGGSGHKVWSGISPAPDHRVVPTNTLKGQPFDTMTSGVMSKLGHRIYDADLGGGYHSKVVETSPGYNNSMYVRGYIYKGKTQVGAFENTLLQVDGKLIANHDEVEISPGHQGHGLADRFNGHAVAEYQRLGVDKITLRAGLEVGGYAWARQGFRYNDEEAPGARQKFLNERLNQVESYIKLLPVLRDQRAVLTKQVKALRKAIEAGEDVQPIHIAAIGEKTKWKQYDDKGNEYPTWAGKQALLGTNWSAAYYFDASQHAVTAAAYQPDVDLRVDVEEFFNKNHSKEDGKFVSGSDGGEYSPAPGMLKEPVYLKGLAGAAQQQNNLDTFKTIHEAALGYNEVGAILDDLSDHPRYGNTVTGKMARDAHEEIKAASQEKLIEAGWPEQFTVYRAGSVNGVVSVSTRPLDTFGKQTAYTVKRSDVLTYGEGLSLHTFQFVEHEMHIEASKLKPVAITAALEEFFNQYHSKEDGRFTSGLKGAKIQDTDDGRRFRAPGAKNHRWTKSTHPEDASEYFTHEVYDRYTAKLSNGLEARILIPRSLDVAPHYLGQIKNEISDGLEIAQAAYPRGGYNQDHITVRLSRFDPTVESEDRDSTMGAVEGKFEGYKPSEINVYGPAVALQHSDEVDDGSWSPAISSVSVLTYTVVHESGHILDENGPYGAQSPRPAPVAASTLSGYATSSKAESYAEAFAEWSITKGTTTNKFVKSQAWEHGWTHGKRPEGGT